MRKGEMAAVVFITSVDAFVKERWEPGFKFLPVRYDSNPAVLEAAEYPGLIK